MSESKFRPIPELTPVQIERFWSLVPKLPDDVCWPWQGARTQNGGYGNFTPYYKLGPYRSHRISFSLHHKVSVAGVCILHACDNPPCVNPAHLFKGTMADNVADKMRKGRHHGGRGPKGSKHGRAKLDEIIVVAVRAKFQAGATLTSLACTYNVSITTIKRVVDKVGWTHVI